MRQLIFIDYAIIGLYIALALFIGHYYFKKASSSMEEFFLSGRSLPWWLIGISMSATNFSIDTPLAVSKFISKYGITGAWYYWASGISAVAAAFLFSTLWRRAKVITDNELIEMRYSGKEAAGLRLFKGIYFGVLINGFVLGWVFKALTKVSTSITPWDPTYILIFFGAITLVYTITGGFYGVVVTDLVQFVFALTGSILLAVLAVNHVGGLDALAAKITALPQGDSYLNFVPNLSDSDQKMSFHAFLVLFLVQWWSHKYSDGGGKHIQRMSSAKNEMHASFGTFFYSIFTYGVVLWPWIVTALCAVVVFPNNPDPEKGYPMMMATVLPHGLYGLCVMSLVGAFMSTIDTHLNLGASYFINDIYKRFLVKDADNRHYVVASRVAILVIMLLSILLSLFITSIGSFYLFVLTFASGAGLTWVLRWFWWRINAYSEISAMLVSAVVASTVKIVAPELNFSYSLLIVIGITTPVFLAVTFLTRPTDEEKLKEFYARVQPSIFGWNKIVKKYSLPYAPYFKQAGINFLLGVVLLFCFNIGIGQMLLKSFWFGLFLVTVSLVLVVVLVRSVKKAWHLST